MGMIERIVETIQNCMTFLVFLMRRTLHCMHVVHNKISLESDFVFDHGRN